MTYWLFKSEPDTWGWDQQVAKGAVGENTSDALHGQKIVGSVFNRLL